MILILLCGCGQGDLKKAENCLGIGDYENAIHFYEQSIQKDPLSYRARRGLGLALWQKNVSMSQGGDKPGAKDWFEVARQLEYALKIKPGDSLKIHAGTAWFQCAKALVENGDSSRALKYVMKSVNYHSGDIGSLNLAGLLHFHYKNGDIAKGLFLTASRKDTVDATGPFNLGMVYWREGNPYKAYEWWLQSLKRDPASPKINYWCQKADRRIKEKAP